VRREEVLETLERHREEICERFGVRSLRLFGSVARNEATESSDVDILVGFFDPPTFRGFMELRIFLEDLLGAKVDLVTETGLKDRARPHVEKDAIRVA
jgi:predicted nucleotidyltransferase